MIIYRFSVLFRPPPQPQQIMSDHQPWMVNIYYLNGPTKHILETILRAGLHYGGEVHQSCKKGHFLIVIGRKCNSWPVGVYTRWRKQWWWTFSWMIKWHGHLRGGTFWSWASSEEFLVRPQEAGEAQLNKKYFIAFNSSLAHPPFDSYNHVLAKHSWPTGDLLHRSVNRP